jgi:hypothetical protein
VPLGVFHGPGPLLDVAHGRVELDFRERAPIYFVGVVELEPAFRAPSCLVSAFGFGVQPFHNAVVVEEVSPGPDLDHFIVGVVIGRLLGMFGSANAVFSIGLAEGRDVEGFVERLEKIPARW